MHPSSGCCESTGISTECSERARDTGDRQERSGAHSRAILSTPRPLDLDAGPHQAMTMWGLKHEVLFQICTLFTLSGTIGCKCENENLVGARRPQHHLFAIL